MSSGGDEISGGGLPTRPETPLKARAQVPVGVAIGEYRVEEKLGSGAFGTVYAGTHPLIGKRVAIKVLDAVHSVDPSMVARFVDEARAVNRIGHENIVDIFSFGELDDGRRYLVMERLDGQPLSALLKERGQLDLDEALAILTPVGNALDAAHAAGIAHRDLKPDNVFLSGGAGGAWRPKLLDFGVAKLLDEAQSSHATASGVTVGTPSYMSPEQCLGKGVDHRSDIYAFGVLAFRMLTGRLPFEAEASSQMMAQHLYEDPPSPETLRPDLPPSASRAILWMLEKDKARRPGSLAEAVAALGSAEGAEPPKRVSSGSHSRLDAPSGMKRLREQRTSQRRLRAIVAVASVVLVAAGGIALWRGERSPQPNPGGGEAPGPAAGSSAPRPTVAAVDPAPAPGPVQPQAPARVRIEIRGVPGSTRIRDGAGTLLREGPGVIEMDRSAEKRRLVLDARDHAPWNEEIVPDRDRVLDVVLVPTPSAERHPGRAGGAKKPPRLNDIEPWR